MDAQAIEMEPQPRRILMRTSLRQATEQDEQLKLRARDPDQAGNQSDMVTTKEFAKDVDGATDASLAFRGRANASFWRRATKPEPEVFCV